MGNCLVLCVTQELLRAPLGMALLRLLGNVYGLTFCDGIRLDYADVPLGLLGSLESAWSLAWLRAHAGVLLR